MIKQSYRVQAIALAAAVLALALPLVPVEAKTRAGSQVFQGLVEHVSPNNVKVKNPATHQILSFLLVPHFKNVFKGNGQTTAQESVLKEGQYVKVYFDQKALGARHADRILILNNSNMAMGKTKG